MNWIPVLAVALLLSIMVTRTVGTRFLQARWVEQDGNPGLAHHLRLHTRVLLLGLLLLSLGLAFNSWVFTDLAFACLGAMAAVTLVMTLSVAARRRRR